MVTRAPAQSKELCERLKELGAEVLLLPLIQFLEPENTSELDRAIRSLETFEWLIFTSANAVTFFLGRCRALGCWPGGHTKIAAVGSVTRSMLEKERLQTSLVPTEFSGAGLATELGGAVAGKSVLLPRSDRAGEELPSMLRKAGANVTDVVAYRTAGPDSLDPPLLEAIRSGQADAVTFFSPSAFREFRNLIGSDALANWNSQVAFAAVGPVTAEAIRAASLPIAIEADEATTAALVAALERHFSARQLGHAGRTAAALNRREP